MKTEQSIIIMVQCIVDTHQVVRAPGAPDEMTLTSFWKDMTIKGKRGVSYAKGKN